MVYVSLKVLMQVMDKQWKQNMFIYCTLCVLQVITQIADKHRRLPEVRECQDGTTNTSSLQRLMNTFEQDIQLLVGQVSPRTVFIS